MNNTFNFNVKRKLLGDIRTSNKAVGKPRKKKDEVW